MEERQKLVGQIVRNEIVNRGASYSDESRRWPIALPTLNRLMNTGNVGVRFYRTAELGLGLPRGFLDAVLDADGPRIAAMTDLDPQLRDFALTELGIKKRPQRRARKAT